MTVRECLEEIRGMSDHGAVDYLACGCGDCLVYMYAVKALEMLDTKHSFGSDAVSSVHSTVPGPMTFTVDGVPSRSPTLSVRPLGPWRCGVCGARGVGYEAYKSHACSQHSQSLPGRMTFTVLEKG